MAKISIYEYNEKEEREFEEFLKGPPTYSGNVTHIDLEIDWAEDKTIVTIGDEVVVLKGDETSEFRIGQAYDIWVKDGKLEKKEMRETNI